MPRQLEFDPSYAREVVDVPVADELSESFLAYSLSVITSRAIPDVRDGLKPVQRRILWSMLQMGIRPGTPFRKSARIVGDTMGRYHPHGDSAIYDTLVRMGQDFSRMLPFIDPQGNFGSLDDPPAASRYTECRLAEAAMDMVRELDEDTVDFRSTYDGEGEEPTVLPAAVPNIIVNGTSGIAVGMATNMAPHNLREVAELIRLVMTKRRPKPTIDEMMKVLPGPDFPSGGTVVNDGLREAYQTGRGSFRIRAKAEPEQITRSRQALVVTELPYLVGPERVISKVQELVNNGRLAGIAGISDLSDMKGLRIQIDLKPGIKPQVRTPGPVPADAAGGDVRYQQCGAGRRRADHARHLRPVPPLHRASPRSNRPPHRVPPRQGTRSPARSRRSAGRARRDRRGRCHHPRLSGRGRSPGKADRTVPADRHPGGPHPRHAAAPTHRPSQTGT